MPEAKVVMLPDVPPKVDLADLKDPDRQRLLSMQETRLVKLVMEGLPVGRYSKQELGEKMAAFCQSKSPEELKALGINEAWPAGKKATRGIVKDQSPDGFFTLYAVYRGKEGKALGAGASGKVKLVQDIENGEWSVLKVMRESDDPDRAFNYGREHTALSEAKMSSGEILTRKKPIPEKEKKEKEKNQKNQKTHQNQHNIIMKYVAGSEVHQLVAKDPQLSAIQWLDIAISAAVDLQKLHNMGMVHRDIKLANMIHNALENKTANVDLGLAKNMDDNKKFQSAKAGTPDYIAPELLPDKLITCSTEIDVYALGISFKKLFGFDKMERLSVDILTGEQFYQPFKTNSPFKSDKELKKFLDRMTAKDPTKRPPLSEVITKLQELRKNLLPVYQMTTGIVNLKDYREAKDKAAFISALKSVDSVFLADSHEKDMKEYRDLQILLEKNGIVVRKEIIISKDFTEIVKKARELDISVKKEGALLSQLCYFHPPGKKPSLEHLQVQCIEVTTPEKNYRKEVEKSEHRFITEAQYERIIKFLFHEINRLNHQNTQAMKNGIPLPIDDKYLVQLDTTVHKLMDHKEKNRLTYHVLHNELGKLDQELMAHKKVVEANPGFVKPHKDRAATASLADTIKKVKQIKQETQADLTIPKMTRH